MTSMPVHIFAQMRNTVSQCRFRSHDVRWTSVLRRSQHPLDAGFEQTEAKRRRNGAETATRPCVNCNWQRPLHLFHLSSFTLHRIFLRQRHHGLNGASLLSKSSLHIIFYPAAGRH